MENLAVHMRITGAQVSNEDVDTRRSAISDLSAKWKKGGSIDLLLPKAAEIALALYAASPPPALGAEIQTAVQKYASAFLYEESPFEVGIVAGMAFTEIVSQRPVATSEWTTSEVLAAAVWSALSYQQPLKETKREALRSEALMAAEAFVAHAAEASRARSSVGDFETLAIKLARPPKKEGDAEATPEPLLTASSNFAAVTSATIAALRRNAALDREELDFLWWCQLGRSRLLGKQMTSLAEPVRLVVAGIEGAAH